MTRHKSVSIGDIFSGTYVDWTVIGFESTPNNHGHYQVIVRSNNGTIKSVNVGTLRKGTIKDPYHPNYYGKGYIGDGKYGTASPIRGIWSSMLRRCYCPKFLDKYPTYAGCTVAPEWHNFQVFAEWYESNYFDGCQIDKDLKIKGNKVYSASTCTLVSRDVNMFIVPKKDKSLATGVRKEGKSYLATRTVNSKSSRIGLFSTELDAFDAFAEDKLGRVQDLDCSSEIKESIMKLLQCRFEEIRNKILSKEVVS